MHTKNIYLFAILLVVGCSRHVTRIDTQEEIDLSGRWNDTDSRKVADQMIYDLFNSDDFLQYKKKLGRQPVIVIGQILNRTTEHIDADNYIKKLEIVIHNSGAATLIESTEFRDKIRRERLEQQEFAEASTVKRFGKELGADLMLFGEMNSETDSYKNQKVVNYLTTLYLTDIETNARVWYGQNEIRKFVRN